MIIITFTLSNCLRHLFHGLLHLYVLEKPEHVMGVQYNVNIA